MGNLLQEALTPEGTTDTDVLLQRSIKNFSNKDFLVQGAFWNFPETFLLGATGSSINQAPGYTDRGYNLVCFADQKNSLGEQISSVILNYRFPINPANIQISIPAAASNTVTMHGMHEESNGSPLRNITISGSMGITPDTVDSFHDKSITKLANPTVLGQLEHAFSNTISAVSNVVTQAQSVLNAFNTDLSDPTAVIIPQSERQGKHTGMAHIHKLARFLDWYMEAKKSNHGTPLHPVLKLGFDMHKDAMFYDCTLKNFSITKPPGSLEYQYSIQLTAYARRSEEHSLGATRSRANTTNSGEPNVIARMVQGLRAARNTVVAAKGVIKATGQDINFIMSPIKEAILLGSELSGLATDLSDYSSKLFTGSGVRGVLLDALADAGFKNSVQFENYRTEASPLGRITSGSDTAYTPSVDRINEDSIARKEARSAARNRQRTKKTSDVDGFDPTKSLTDTDPNVIKIPDIFDSILDDPDGNIEFFSKVSASDIASRSKGVSDILRAERERISLLTLAALLTKRDNMEKNIAAVSASLGGAHPTYDRIYNRNTPEQENFAVAPKKLSLDDIALLSTLNDALIALDRFILAFKERQSGSGENYYTFYAQSARDAGLSFDNAQSKFYVPMPTDVTMEQLAFRYLGSGDRWIEIAALNGLKTPYIDEDGFRVNLQGNGSGNQFCVSNSENLFIGQTIKMFSDTQRPSSRRITKVDEVSEVKTLITVSDDEDLSRFREDENAYFQAFLPDTVNSNLMIAIPSAVPINLPGTVKTSPDTTDLSRMLYTGKTDFRLTFSSRGDEADIAFGPNDVLVARGIHNIVQAANTIVLTKQGDLIHAPTFGNPIVNGINTADTTAGEIYQGLVSSFGGDSRFRQIIANRVRIRGPVAAIDLLLDVDGSDAFLPLTVAVPRV